MAYRSRVDAFVLECWFILNSSSLSLQLTTGVGGAARIRRIDRESVAKDIEAGDLVRRRDDP
ncbi:MAG: hypothetical protein ACRD3J_21810 [Thermoanaerobaculia bacterium]